MKKNILFQEPYKSNKVKKYVNQSLNSNYYTADYFEDKCKDLLKNKFGLKNTFITHSATGALEMAALLTKENKKQKVYLPSYTFSSTANAFLRAGYDIKFLDINPDDLMINLDRVIKNAKNKLFHFHVAENDRGIPGSGTLDFDSIFETLKEINYSANVTLEMFIQANKQTSKDLFTWRDIEIDPYKAIKDSHLFLSKYF